MAVFPNFKLTNNGTNLLNRVIAEKKILKFTKFQIGDGVFTGDIKTLDSLVAGFKNFPVLETNSLPNGYTGLKGYFDNKDLTEQKHLREVGVYAQIGDEVVTEVLFSYTNAGDTADIIPSQTTFFSRTLSVLNKTDDVQNVTFNLNLEFKKTDFNTVAELKSATWLSTGDKINLWGNLILGDVKKTSKIIVTETTGIPLLNGLFAKDYADFLEAGNYTGTGEILSNGSNAIWGGEFAGYIQDTTIKEVGKRYIDKFDKKAYECIKVGSNVNTTEFYKECTVKGNLEKLQNLSSVGTTIRVDNNDFKGDIVFIVNTISRIIIFYINAVVLFDTNSTIRFFANLPANIPKPLMESVTFCYGSTGTRYSTTCIVDKAGIIKIGYNQVGAITLVSGVGFYNY